MIKTENLRFSYGSRKILKGCTLEAKAGEVTAVLGQNGAGKTTLFRCILGLNHGYTGSIEIDGKSAVELSPKALAKRVSYIPQVHYPSFNYSVFDMVLMGTGRQVYAFSSPKKAQYDAVNDALHRVGIEYLAHRDYCAISGGEQQLTLIARALAQNTKTLIMDEPTASLDYGNQIRVMRQIRTLAHEGYTVLLSIHNPQQALCFADNVVALKDGVTLASGAPEKVITSENIKSLYGVEVRVEIIQNRNVIIPNDE